MQRNVIAILFFLVSLIVTSCSKMDALFKNGEPVTEYRDVNQPFTVVSMFNNVNVRLVQDRHPRLELTCPKNLIEKITTEVDNDTLVIRNENNFNWIRSFDYNIDLTVYYDSLRSINFYSIGQLLSTDSLVGMKAQVVDTVGNVNDSIKRGIFILRILEGSGDIDLTFNCNILKTVFNNGTSTVTLKGRAGYTEHYMKSYGVIHAENMYSNIVKVMSHSTNDIYVWAHSTFHAHLHNIGNAYYKGHPWIESECTSDGRVIPMEE